MKKILVYIFIIFPLFAYSQVLLNADGVTNTYSLINSVLAPGATAVETPDAFDPGFEPHIKQVYDADLGKYVFEFYLHISNSNELQDESTGDTDRQRVEIKTYDASPDSLKGTMGETIKYKWRFKVPAGFQPSTNFTHIHQIKAVGGDDSNPLFTLTPRYNSSGNRLELNYYDGQNPNIQSKLTEVNLSSFENTWVEATEQIHIDSIHGSYSITINKVSDGTTLMTYSNSDLCTFRSTNTFTRPKWGIYRSILSMSYLRDETMRFNSFSVQELKKLTQTITFPTLPASVYGDDNFDPGAFSSVGPSLKVSYTSSNTAVATVISSGSNYVNDSIHIVGAGTTTITAKQAGDASYAAATNVSQTLTVSKSDQSIAFGAITKAIGDADFSPGIASSGLAVSYQSSNTGVATIVNGKIHVVGAGTSTITASQAGNTNYNAAPDNAQTLTVTTAALYVYSPTSITVTAGTSSGGTYASLASNDANYVKFNSSTTGTRKTDWYASTIVSQSASSIAKLIVNYDGKNQSSKTQILYLYNFTTTVWDQIDSRSVSSTDVTITYEQANPANYISSGGEIRLRVYTSGGAQNYVSNADWIQFTLQNITKSNQSITFGSLPAKTVGDADFAPSATASSGLPVTYASSNQSVATIVNNQIHIVGAGTTDITASQGGDSFTNAASDVIQNLIVSKTNQTITFDAIPTKSTGMADFDPLATASSGLSVVYASSNANVATIINGLVHIVGAGTSTITASQAGDSNTNPASDVTQLLTVNATSSVLMEETFNYSDFPTVAGTAEGWTTTYSTTSGTPSVMSRATETPALTYPLSGTAYVNSGVGKVLKCLYTGATGASYASYKGINNGNSITSGIVYLSFLYKVQAKGGSYAQIIGMTGSGTSTGGVHLWYEYVSTTTFKLGITRYTTTTSTAGNVITYSSTLDATATYFIVIKYDVANKIASFFVNPVIGSTSESGVSAIDDGTNNVATTLTSLSHLLIRGTASSNSNFYIGGIRVSTSWTDAVASTGITTDVLSAKDKITIKTTGKTVFANEIGTIQIYNLQGALVIQKNNTTQLATSLNTGIYIVRFRNSAGESNVQKIEIQ